MLARMRGADWLPLSFFLIGPVLRTQAFSSRCLPCRDPTFPSSPSLPSFSSFCTVFSPPHAFVRPMASSSIQPYHPRHQRPTLQVLSSSSSSTPNRPYDEGFPHGFEDVPQRFLDEIEEIACRDMLQGGLQHDTHFCLDRTCLVIRSPSRSLVPPPMSMPLTTLSVAHISTRAFARHTAKTSHTFSTPPSCLCPSLSPRTQPCGHGIFPFLPPSRPRATSAPQGLPPFLPPPPPPPPPTLPSSFSTASTLPVWSTDASIPSSLPIWTLMP